MERSAAVVGWSRRVVLAVAALAIHSVAASCSTTDATPTSDASVDDTVGPIHDASLPPEPETRCADSSCVDPEIATWLDERACCLSSGGCGLRARALSPVCLPPHGLGDVDLACPGARLEDGTAVQGCCTPAGRCGLYDRFGDLGCVPSTLPDGGAAGRTCNYTPGTECRTVVEVTCDGPEDCGAGQVCCGRASHGVFDAFGCFEACDAQSANAAELWLEVCHEGSVCRNERDTCERTTALPTFLGHCRTGQAPHDGGASIDAGPRVTGASCGATSCGTGEKCCLRDPAPPYCSAASTPCACAPGTDGGGRD